MPCVFETQLHSTVASSTRAAVRLRMIFSYIIAIATSVHIDELE